MTGVVKAVVKELFPRFSLQMRVKKLLAANVDPDMCFLADLKRFLLEQAEYRRFASFLTPQHTAIDVGACGGEYAYIMAQYFGKVFSIEPTPEMAAKLRRALPVNCEALECAVGRSPGSVTLRIPKIAGARMHALSTVATHDFAFSEIGTIDAVSVRQTTIDELVLEKSIRPAFIKIDVEGYEGEVLQGAVETIQSCKPIFLVEIEKRHNKQFSEIFSLLESKGYVPFHFQDNQLKRSSQSQVDDSYDFLIGGHVSGMEQVIASRASGKYINNFLFLPCL